jgi:hypothetical protein
MFEGITESFIIKQPEKSEWTLHCANIIYTPDKGKEPNWFHRKMQELILGFKWRKNK